MSSDSYTVVSDRIVTNMAESVATSVVKPSIPIPSSCYVWATKQFRINIAIIQTRSFLRCSYIIFRTILPKLPPIRKSNSHIFQRHFFFHQLSIHGLRAWRPGYDSLQKQEIFLSSTAFGSGTQPAPYPMGTGGSFSGDRAAGVWSWLLTSA
jgi:hypothetical protein